MKKFLRSYLKALVASTVLIGGVLACIGALAGIIGLLRYEFSHNHPVLGFATIVIATILAVSAGVASDDAHRNW